MGRPRNPNRERAYHMWVESGGKRLIQDISDKLGVSASQVRAWKSQDKWTLPAQRNKGTKRGAPFRNRNAVGNKGGAPVGNKNALTTGEYETITPDDFTDDEREFLTSISHESNNLIRYIINSTIIRDRRMAKLSQSEIDLGLYLIIEESRTRLQASFITAINSLHRVKTDKARLDLEEKKNSLPEEAAHDDRIAQLIINSYKAINNPSCISKPLFF